MASKWMGFERLPGLGRQNVNAISKYGHDVRQKGEVDTLYDSFGGERANMENLFLKTCRPILATGKIFGLVPITFRRLTFPLNVMWFLYCIFIFIFLSWTLSTSITYFLSSEFRAVVDSVMVYVSLLGCYFAIFAMVISSFLLAVKCRTFRHLVEMAEIDFNEEEFRMIRFGVFLTKIALGFCWLVLRFRILLVNYDFFSICVCNYFRIYDSSTWRGFINRSHSWDRSELWLPESTGKNPYS